MIARHLVVAVISLTYLASVQAQAQPDARYSRTEDVIYHRKDGVSLTMDVMAPKEKLNGAGVILVVSAQFESSKKMLDGVAATAAPRFLDRGYAVFLVTHGSQPRFTVPEIVQDIHRAVRFIKARADKYKVDPDRLGIAGASSGGQLCLMIGCDGKVGSTKSLDPDEQFVEKQSSKVAAVACIFPVTDFRAFEKDPPKGFDPTDLFPHRERNKNTGEYEVVSAKRRYDIGLTCSPVLFVTKHAAPTRVIHGDADKLVPVKQSQDLHAKFEECGAKCHLDVIKGMGHTVLEASLHISKLVDWFDIHLKVKANEEYQPAVEVAPTCVPGLRRAGVRPIILKSRFGS